MMIALKTPETVEVTILSMISSFCSGVFLFINILETKYLARLRFVISLRQVIKKPPVERWLKDFD